MKRMMYIALLMLPTLSFASVTETVIALLKTAPEKVQEAPQAGKELEALKKLGIINKEPDIVADYNHIYIANKQVSVLGGMLLALDHEYFKHWIGCCVNPGVAVVLDVKKEDSDLSELASFARENLCTVTSFEKAIMTREAEESLLEISKKEDMVVLSCKLHDESNNQTE